MRDWCPRIYMICLERQLILFILLIILTPQLSSDASVKDYHTAGDL